MITIVICILCVAIPAFYIFQARKGHSILTLAVTTFVSIMLAIGIIVFVQPKQFFPVIGASLIGVALTIVSVAMNPRDQDSNEAKTVKSRIKNTIQIGMSLLVACATIANYLVQK